MSEDIYEYSDRILRECDKLETENNRLAAELTQARAALSAIAEIARTDGGAELKDTPVSAWDKVLKLASGGAEVIE